VYQPIDCGKIHYMTAEKDNGERREINPPSPEMTKLIKENPHFLSNWHSGLCSQTTLNYVGALLVAGNVNEFTSLAQKHNKPAFIETFEHIITQEHAPLHLYDMNTTTYTPLTTIQGETVQQDILIKNAVGKLTGVVINGPYKGMIAQRNSAGLWTAERVFNNEVVPSVEGITKFPYAPIWSQYTEGKDTPFYISQKDLLRRKFSEYLAEQHLIHRGKNRPGHLLISDLFLDLCETNGIAAEGLHYSMEDGKLHTT
jgi:hypothetical protein